MKPFVFLAAFEKDPELEPTSPVLDSRFRIDYEGQTWSPENYGKKYFGEVPLFFALKESLNAAAAQVGLKAGLNSIIEQARLAGATSPLSPVPAITLGAFELYPTEVLTMYSTLAQLGDKRLPIWIRGLSDLDGKTLWINKSAPEPTLSPISTAQLVGMMKIATKTGTAKAISLARPTLNKITAGKTGTTSDNRDTWFAGFTPHQSTVVWVGYDKNEKTGLTGASGALPIWIQFTLKATEHHPAGDFEWPDGTELRTVKNPQDQDTVDLIFKE